MSGEKKAAEMSLNTPTCRRMVKKLGTTSGYVTGEPVLGSLYDRGRGDVLETSLRKTPSNRT